MRVYFEKPRTTLGWKWLLIDPHLDETFRINGGEAGAAPAAGSVVNRSEAEGTSRGRAKSILKQNSHLACPGVPWDRSAAWHGFSVP
jgi:hypothetical protein